MVRTTLKITLPKININGTGGKNEGVFEIRSWSMSQRHRTGFLVGEDPSEWRQTALDKITDGDFGVSKYRDFHVNLGTGNRIFDLSFTGFEGDTTVTWGDDNVTPAPNAANAEGGSALEKMQVMERYFAAITPDSGAPVELQFGGYDDSDLFHNGSNLTEDRLYVVPENPEFTYNPRGDDGGNTFRGEITFVETIQDDELISIVPKELRDLV